MEKNPILLKLIKLIKTGKMSKEKIAVVSDIKYHTISNIWTRPTVSKYVLLSLKVCGLITDKDIAEYTYWVNTVAPKKPYSRKNVSKKKKYWPGPKGPKLPEGILLENDPKQEIKDDVETSLSLLFKKHQPENRTTEAKPENPEQCTEKVQ